VRKPVEKKNHILILDDDPLALKSIELALVPKYETHSFLDHGSAENFLEKQVVDLAILDLNLPQKDGIQILREWKERFASTPVVFCSGEDRIERAVKCLREGAADYIPKPFNKADVRFIIDRTLDRCRLKERVERLSPLVHPAPTQFVGNSKAIAEIKKQISVLKGETHINVLILGESGTGKEVIARLLHQQEQDPKRPFVVANMPAIPSSLMESELFGVEKGAFTDAKSSRAGKFELADRGDIFLDEIGDLPTETQSKILRTIQERTVERVGSQRSRQVSFRVISATNQPLSDLLSQGRFREDLLYRLNDMVIMVPPLREHVQDVPRLAQHFVEKYSHAGKIPRLSDRVLRILMDYHWPGNIRQLESTLKRTLIFDRGSVIENINIFDPTSLTLGPKVSVREPKSNTYQSMVSHYEKGLIEDALKRHHGNRTAAMQELKLPRATFYRKISELKIPLSALA